MDVGLAAEHTGRPCQEARPCLLGPERERVAGEGGVEAWVLGDHRVHRPLVQLHADSTQLFAPLQAHSHPALILFSLFNNLTPLCQLLRELLDFDLALEIVNHDSSRVDRAGDSFRTIDSEVRPGLVLVCLKEVSLLQEESG